MTQHKTIAHDREALQEVCNALQIDCASLRKQHESDTQRIASLERQVVNLTLDLDRTGAQLGIAASEKAALVAAKRSLHSVAGALEQRVRQLQEAKLLGDNDISVQDNGSSDDDDLLDMRRLNESVKSITRGLRQIAPLTSDLSLHNESLSILNSSSVHHLSPKATNSPAATSSLLDHSLTNGLPNGKTSFSPERVRNAPMDDNALPASPPIDIAHQSAVPRARGPWVPPTTKELQSAAAAVAARTAYVAELEQAAVASRSSYEQRRKMVAETFIRQPPKHGES